MWDRALEIATDSLEAEGRDTLIFGSALNLLLFSKTYGDAMQDHLERMLQQATMRTYFLSLSSNVMPDRIGRLEAAADHLMVAEMSRPRRELQLQVRRLTDAPYREEPVIVPFARDLLQEMKHFADEARRKNLAVIKRI